MAADTPNIPSNRVFIYNHKDLCVNPSTVLKSLAKFLDISFTGFQDATPAIKVLKPDISNDLKSEYDQIASQIHIQDLKPASY
jgi:hypothetical protein